MKDQTFHEALELLQEARRESARNAQGRAEELVDRAVKRLQQGLNDKHISNRELFELFSRIIAGWLGEMISTAELERWGREAGRRCSKVAY